MKIVTGLEVVIERIENESYKANIKDAIDYILYLEKKLKEMD